MLSCEGGAVALKHWGWELTGTFQVDSHYRCTQRGTFAVFLSFASLDSLYLCATVAEPVDRETAVFKSRKRFGFG
jgi:hypothetical protein